MASAQQKLKKLLSFYWALANSQLVPSILYTGIYECFEPQNYMRVFKFVEIHSQEFNEAI